VHGVRTAQFDEESARFAFRFCCEDCGHFDAAHERCRHDWPIELHRRPTRPTDGHEPLVFCKEFELC
jgi:hypothetical protein